MALLGMIFGYHYSCDSDNAYFVPRLAVHMDVGCVSGAVGVGAGASVVRF